MEDPDLYACLGVARDASAPIIKRAWRTAASRYHPDRPNGDAAQFSRAQRAFTVLSNAERRRRYDASGVVEPTASEEFAASFANGSFDQQQQLDQAGRQAEGQLRIIDHDVSGARHSAGFEAWLRARSGTDGEASVFTAESAALQFGVVPGSYQPVALQPLDPAYEVVCSGAGEPAVVLGLRAAQLPAVLDWGHVAVEMHLAPVSPADLYSARLGGVYGDVSVEAPYIAGHEGVGIVTQVGPGVKELQEGDMVLPLSPFMGTWRSLAVWPARELVRVPMDVGLPPEYLAMSMELCLAYALLEQHGSLRPGDCVILNAANSTVGLAVIQLCKVLRLRSVAVARDGPGAAPWERMCSYLESLGASAVLKDSGSLKSELAKLKFFSSPKLALDAVGGESGVRLADTLSHGGELVIYGCMSGRLPPFQWHAFVFKGLRVSGFNLRKWLGMSSGPESAKGISPSAGHAVMATNMTNMLQCIGKLVTANLLHLNFTEYELASELEEALEHAMDRGKNTKVLLRGRQLQRTARGADLAPAAVRRQTQGANVHAAAPEATT